MGEVIEFKRKKAKGLIKIDNPAIFEYLFVEQNKINANERTIILLVDCFRNCQVRTILPDELTSASDEFGHNNKLVQITRIQANDFPEIFQSMLSLDLEMSFYGLPQEQKEEIRKMHAVIIYCLMH